MNKLHINKLSNNEKSDRSTNKIKKTPINHKHIKKHKTNETILFKGKIRFDKNLFIETTSKKLSICSSIFV